MCGWGAVGKNALAMRGGVGWGWQCIGIDVQNSQGELLVMRAPTPLFPVPPASITPGIFVHEVAADSTHRLVK